MSQWNQEMISKRENKEAHQGMMRMMNQTLILAAVTAKKRNETPCKISMMIFKMESFWRGARGRPPRSVTSL
jgi:hypothetical protein